MNASQEVVTLSGPALRGIGPHVAALASLPTTVRLGRIRPAALPAAPRFASYFQPALATVKPPAEINRRDRAAESLARMYQNDRYGCCVIAGKMHALGLWSGADATPGGPVLATDAEVLSQYRSICGPGDRGCVIGNVLDVMRSRGLVAGGKAYKIDGYVACDHTDKLATMVVQYLFGATTIGINLPEAWTRAAVWDVTNTQIVGGHDVTPIDYNDAGVFVSSWGRLYLMTWEAWTSRTWIEEYYALLSPLWYGDDRLSPSGVDAASLKLDLDKLAHGVLPPLPEPPAPPAAGPVAAVVLLDKDGKELQRIGG